jgi:cytochrome c peroxidase
MLFWDEQLSSDDTVACGTCHQPAAGGADARLGVHRGPDLALGTDDDVTGSPGVIRQDADGSPVFDALFGTEVQVTGRAANPFLVAPWVSALFWDGRATSAFVDPETGAQGIAAGGALESQAVGPILSDVEMAHEGRTWDHVRTKLATVPPLQFARQIPADLADALVDDPSYPDLFAAAFGDPGIDASRIAFAIATYERSLVPDDTPWDRFQAGDTTALTDAELAGWDFFRTSPCATCHAPPLFTDGSFRNIGVRPVADDPGRQAITGIAADAGRFKVPSLRGAGLKASFLHDGSLRTLPEVIAFYLPGNDERVTENLDPLIPVRVPPGVRADLAAFLRTGLTDPSVAAETFPFDRPQLRGRPGEGGTGGLSCGLGFELALLLPWLIAGHGRRRNSLR